MNNEPLPQIHLIRDTDLITFAYELHIFAGDFLRELEFNIHSLVTNTGADSGCHYGEKHMWLSDALHAYCSTADLHQMIFTTEYIGARAFLFHTDRKEDGRLYGDVMMLDLDTLRQDVKKEIPSPLMVLTYIVQMDAWKQSALKKWHSMELCEKDALKSWGFCYRPEQVTEWQHHYSGMFSRWKEQAFSYMAPGFGGTSEHQLYGGGTEPPYRHVPHTAGDGPGQMLLYDEAPVLPTFPSGPEKRYPPIAAVRGEGCLV